MAPLRREATTRRNKRQETPTRLRPGQSLPRVVARAPPPEGTTRRTMLQLHMRTTPTLIRGMVHHLDIPSFDAALPVLHRLGVRMGLMGLHRLAMVIILILSTALPTTAPDTFLLLLLTTTPTPLTTDMDHPNLRRRALLKVMPPVLKIRPRQVAPVPFLLTQATVTQKAGKFPPIPPLPKLTMVLRVPQAHPRKAWRRTLTSPSNLAPRTMIRRA